ncbi:dehydrogenase/reductase SDR family member 1-like [Saccoglossus kowalevskii]|uniref:Dehydrogenase/reductase SDR family member 1-like n=1 Tax=Saccoglossus kowalevskii TaxID=10224 RepID=A0ABM0MA67_SACKO|nr:PREDICTED: dehydrogenase/reductase SDR family member 1-like [Saccoglossus kowalevskii]
MSRPLLGKVCVVTGASRGIGKGIALQLGEAGATVYITGRTFSPNDTPLPGSLQETAKQVEERGGTCIPVKCDHTDDKQVEELFDKINKEQNGRLDLLVNNAYAAVKALTQSGFSATKFWELEPELWDTVNNVGLRGHYVASVFAARMMVPAKQGLIINISSPGGLMYFINVAYGAGKAGVDKMAFDCAHELRKHSVAAVSLYPGAVRTELINDMLSKAPPKGDTAIDNQLKIFENGESPEFSGRGVVHLLSDPNIMKKSGRILFMGDVASEYGFTDIDGKVPFHSRRVKDVLQLSGHTWLSMFIPKFVTVPRWMMAVFLSKL